MKVRNPHFVGGRGARIEALKTALDAYLRAHPDMPAISSKEIRAAIGPRNLTDGEIAQAAQDMKLERDRG